MHKIYSSLKGFSLLRFQEYFSTEFTFGQIRLYFYPEEYLGRFYPDLTGDGTSEWLCECIDTDVYGNGKLNNKDFPLWDFDA